MKRMSSRQFGKVVVPVIESLPAKWQRHLHNVVVDVEEEPDEETLCALEFTAEEIAAGESLYGLFAPLKLPSESAGNTVDVADLPHHIIIYKRPLGTCPRIKRRPCF